MCPACVEMIALLGRKECIDEKLVRPVANDRWILDLDVYYKKRN